MADTRNALIFSDGSMAVFSEGWPMEKIEAERECYDERSAIVERTKIAAVSVTVETILFDPTTLEPGPVACKSCQQSVKADWTYCPFCGAQGRMKRKAA